MSNINEWERGVDRDGGYYIEPETGKRYRWMEIGIKDPINPIIGTTVIYKDQDCKIIDVSTANNDIIHIETPEGIRLVIHKDWTNK